MRDAVSDIERLGGRLVIVGNGAPHFAKAFAEDENLVGHVFTDPKRNVYRALGMVRSRRATFALETVKNAARAYRNGFRQTSVKGDPWQHGGVVVVSPGDVLVYSYLSRVAGDHPPVRDVLAAVERESGRAEPERGWNTG